MYITTPKRKNGSTVVRIVECFRDERKIRSRIIKTVGQSKDADRIAELISAVGRSVRRLHQHEE